MKRFLFVLLALLAVNASAQTAIPERGRQTFTNMFLGGPGTGGIGWPGYASDPFACGTLTARATYYNTGSNVVKFCDGTAWRTISTLGVNNTFSGSNTFSGTNTFSGVATFSAQPLLTTLTASRIMLTDSSKGPVSNGAITTNAIPKSASSGASLSASALSDDGTNVTSTEPFIDTGSNGSQVSCGWGAMENLTLATGGTTTDTSGNLLPANSIIYAVVGRVTTTITASCTGWELGDGTSAARFTANDTTLTANETQVGITQFNGNVSTTALGPTQAAAAKVRVTCAGGNPGAGAIRIQVYSCTFTGPTS